MDLENDSLEQLILQKKKSIKYIRLILEAECRQLEEFEKLRAGEIDLDSILIKSEFVKPIFYNQMTWKEKIIHVIENSGKPIPAKVIWPILLSWEPELSDKKDLRKVVSNFLSMLVKAGTVLKEKRTGQVASLYSLPSKP